MTPLGKQLPLAALILTLLGASGAAALDIALSYSGGFENRPEAVAAMEQAADIWERVLSDPVTLEFAVLEVPVLSLGFFVQGGAFAAYDGATYTELRAAFLGDATSADDVQAVAHLPPSPRLSFRTWDADRIVIVNNGDDVINNELEMPRANAKALGLTVNETDGLPDANIKWDAWFLDNVFDFDRTNGVDGTDFLGVAVHEIGHALGFGSGVDCIDQAFAGLLLIPPGEVQDHAMLYPLDLFRYSAESVPSTELTPGIETYFSVDGGATSLATFATGENFGDGWQAGHWEAGTEQGIMDAHLPDHAIHNLSTRDLRAMDVIGWDLAAGGDFTRDGAVDGADLAQWQGDFGVNADSDADGDGDSDGDDFLAWQRQLDADARAVPDNAAVPEPTSAALGLLALAAVRVFSRRSHRAAT